MSCKKAQGFLEQYALTVKEATDATKVRRGRDDALAVARTVDTIHVAKGKNVVTIDMKNAPPDDDTLAGHLLAPSTTRTADTGPARNRLPAAAGPGRARR